MNYDRWKTRSPDDEAYRFCRYSDDELSPPELLALWQQCDHVSRRPDVWLELTKSDSVNGEDQKTYINFSQVIEITPVPHRNVTVLLFSAGFRTEVKEPPDAILRSLEGGAR